MHSIREFEFLFWEVVWTVNTDVYLESLEEEMLSLLLSLLSLLMILRVWQTPLRKLHIYLYFSSVIYNLIWNLCSYAYLVLELILGRPAFGPYFFPGRIFFTFSRWEISFSYLLAIISLNKLLLFGGFGP